MAALWAAIVIALPGCKRYSDVSAPNDPESARLSQSAQPGQASPAPGQFLDSARQPVESAWVGAQAAKAAYVLIGEAHTSACDHETQARVLALMAEAGTPPAVGLEMVSLDAQPILDLFNKGIIGLEELEERLVWGQTWGFPFEIYRPIFETARRLELPLYALNVPRDVARKVGRSGFKGLSMEERLGLPSKIIPVPKEQEESLRAVFDSHPFGKPKDRKAAWESFITVQALWDTAMARRAVEARVATRRPVAIIAGGGHVERGWGIASRLAVFDPAGQRLLLMPWRGGQDPDPLEADLFFYCPEVKRPRLGLTLETKNSAIAVVAVESGSRADAAGLKAGDVLVKAQGAEVKSLPDLHSATMRALKEGGTLRLDILRDGRPETLQVPLPDIRSGS
ncbi:MAG: ChaN family lipoprotein [Acidobacteriota bacterium]